MTIGKNKNIDYLRQEVIDIENSKNNKLAKEVYNELVKEGVLERSSPEAFAFIITGLNFIYQKTFTKKELKDIITDGKGDKEIDVINIDKYIDIFEFSNDDLSSDQIITLKNSIKEHIIKRPLDYSVFNERLKAKLVKIHKGKNHKKIRLFIVRNSEWTWGGKEMNDLKKEIESTKDGEFIYLNRDNLIQKITEPEDYLLLWKVSIDSSEEIMYVSENKNVALIRIPIKDLLDLKKKNDKAGINLFNKNVRIFLNNKNLSEQIKNVIDTEPEMFSIYHNGILITTSAPIEKSAGKILIEQPQIVNGAQTINSLYSKYSENLNDSKLKKAKIICKIIVADKKLTNKVCETSNTQIPIKLWDLRANDDIQLILEKIINNLQGGKYYYSRKGSKKKKNKITITLAEFTQWIYAIISKDPAFAKNDKKLLFDIVSKDGKYGEIERYIQKIRPKEIEKLCEISTFIKAKIKKEKPEKRGLLRDANIHMIVAMYIKNSMTDLYYRKVVSFIERYVREIKKKNPNITNNRIFTKYDDIWNKLIKIK